MDIVNLKVHKIDIAADSWEEISYSNKENDFINYINGILEVVINREKSRRYKFISDTSEMYTLVTRCVNVNKFTESANRSSKRLMTAEKKTQQKITHLDTEIQKGILIQAHVKDNKKDKFIVCKADDIQFIDDKKFKLASGLPIKRKIFKSCLIAFESNKKISGIDVYDTVTPFSTYWWSGYLELEPVLDDSQNTLRAFNAIDNRILSPIKKTSPADHYQLRASLIKQLRTRSSFDIKDYADNLAKKYNAVNKNLNLNLLVDTINELPQKYGFDNTFEAVPEVIKSKVKQVIELGPNIDLILKEGLDTTGIIFPVKAGNEKFLKIRTDVGYETFIQKQAR